MHGDHPVLTLFLTTETYIYFLNFKLISFFIIRDFCSGVTHVMLMLKTVADQNETLKVALYLFCGRMKIFYSKRRVLRLHTYNKANCNILKQQ